MWSPPPDVRDAARTGYGHIACFVSVPSLRGLRGLSFGWGEEARRADPSDLVYANRTIARHLYNQLRDCKTRYDREPWYLGRGQRLRDPGWTLAPGESGTCMDLAILFAAMCLREGLAPYLVMMRSTEAAHAMVALDLARAPDERTVSRGPKGAEGDLAPGMYRVEGASAMAADADLLLIDCVLATRSHALEFDDAAAKTRSVIGASDDFDIRLVDIATRQASGDTELDAPLTRSALRRRLPTPGRPLTRFASRQAITDQLLQPRGRIVLLGQPGVGKSALARDAAARVDEGVGWFLSATNKTALVAALAESELDENGQPARGGEAVDPAPFARAALRRLSLATTAWAVVIDNADREPREIETLLPRPNPAAGQALIITSTNDKWRDWGAEVIDVEPLDAEESVALLESEALVELAGGRPLLTQAFTSARRHLELAPDELAAQLRHVLDLAAATAGPAAFWALLTRRLDLGALKAARLMAWLVPEGTPWEVLAACGVPESAMRELHAVGLTGDVVEDGGREATLHRLFGQVIRDDLRQDRRAGLVAVELLGTPAIRALLMSRGDGTITKELAKALTDGEELSARGQAELGMALWALGTLQEMFETTKVSAASFKAAMMHLREDHPDDRPLIADCLHGQARDVNQHRYEDAGAVVEARRWVQRALELRDQSDAAGKSRHRALDGLLQQRYATNALPFGSPEQVSELQGALKLVDQSWRERREVLGADDLLVDRALFNRGGVRIDLAQRDREHAADYLRVADEVYRATLQTRSWAYGDPHPLTAASHHGVALTCYYRALLDDPSEADAFLVEATREANISLEQRHETDGGTDGNDASKSARLLGKIALLRWQLSCGDDLRKVFDEIERERGTGPAPNAG